MKAEDWSELLLAGRDGASLAWLLQRILPLETLRDLAGRHGVKPRGGFRVQKAQAGPLAELLAEEAPARKRLLGDLTEELEGLTSPRAPSGDEERLPRLENRVRSLEHRLRKAEALVEREEKSAAKARRSLEETLAEKGEKERLLSEFRGRLRNLEDQNRLLASDLEEVTSALAGGEGELQDRSEFQRELTRFKASDIEHRREIAGLTSRVRELEDHIQELETLLPRGKKERIKLFKRSLLEMSGLQGVQLWPTDAFLRSLEDLDSEEQRRIWIALAQAVLMGLDYPGLEAKALKNLGGLWSLRAGMGLRVYFVRGGDKIRLRHAGRREDQKAFFKKHRDG